MNVLRRLFAFWQNSRALSAWQPPSVYVGDHTVLVRTNMGYKLYVDSRDLSLAPHILLDGHWEPAVSRYLARTLKPDMRVVEVGANVGYHTVHMAHLIGPRGVFACFEANPRLAALVNQNVEINGFRERTIVCAYVAADRLGQMEFNLFDKHLGASSLVASDMAAAEYNDTITRVTVPCTTLDAACSDWPHINFLKIDAEGAEPMVLEGAKSLLARSPDVEILLEFGPAFWPSVTEAEAFLRGMQRDGFNICRLNADGSASPVAVPDLLDPTRLAELVLSRGGHSA